MQISELNTNLLKALGGQSQVRADSKSESQFSDLLQITQNDKNSEELGIPRSGESKESKNVSVREVKPEDNRVSNPQEAVPDKKTNKTTNKKTEEQSKNNKETANTANAEKTTAENPVAKEGKTQVKKEAEDSVVDTKGAPVISEPIVVENVENIENMVLAMIVNPAVETLTPKMPEVTVENGAEVVETLSEVETGDLFVPQSDVQNPILEETVVNLNDVQNITKDNPEQEVVENVISGVAEEKTDDVEIVKVKSQPQKNDSISQENHAPEVEAEVIQVQEEKIAEKLPDDVKLKVNVSVHKDVVTSFEEIDPVVSNISNVEDVVEPQEVQVKENVEGIDISQSDTKQNEAKINWLDNVAPIATVETNYVNEAPIVTSQQEDVTITTLAQTPISGAVVSEIIPETTKNHGTFEFKNVENQGLTRDVAEQIKVNITQSAIKGVDKVEIQLKPADLGKIEVKLQIGRDGQFHAHITAANVETLEMLQKDINSLKEAFAGAGYQTDDGSFSFNWQGENENNEREKMREFVGDIITHDVEEETAANDYIGADRVNIRV